MGSAPVWDPGRPDFADRYIKMLQTMNTRSACNADATLLQGVHTVERLFADTLGHEPIHGNCPHCHSVNSRTKTTELINKPRVLVLHLKRWEFIRELRRAEKINTTVSYETLFPLDAGNVYELCSVVVHHGNVGGGHYTAFVRAGDLLWYDCNDAAPPRACSVDEVLNATAYMLFYQRL